MPVEFVTLPTGPNLYGAIDWATAALTELRHLTQFAMAQAECQEGLRAPSGSCGCGRTTSPHRAT